MMMPHDNVKGFLLETALCEESALFYSNDDAERGYIGHIRVDFGQCGYEFWYTWFEHSEELKTLAFQGEFENLINHLRNDGNILSSLKYLTAYCHTHPAAKLVTKHRDDTYGFKIITDLHSFYIRALLTQGDYNIYCYCFNRGRLEEYLAAAI
jgi:hypothetical protein